MSEGTAQLFGLGPNEWQAIGQTLAGVAAMIAVLGALFGGLVGLRRYRMGLRISAAELMLRMEEEFRHILPSVMKWEEDHSYDRVYRELLARHCRHEALNDDELKLLVDLDRSLRFFYLGTVLQNDLRIEQNVLIRTHYYYLAILDDCNTRPELNLYIQLFYPRLNDWLTRHRAALTHFRRTGVWSTWRIRSRSRHRFSKVTPLPRHLPIAPAQPRS